MVAIPAAEPVMALDGIYVAGAPGVGGGALVAPPHPLYGGSMDSPVVNELAHACGSAGLASLRFDWRGIGASGGSPSGEGSDAEADVAAALAHLEQTVEGDLVGCGYSFGAVAVLRAARDRPRVRRLVLVSPPSQLLAGEALASWRRPMLLVTGDRDGFAPPAELEALVRGVPALRLQVVEGADHFFVDGLAAVGRAVSEWLVTPGP
jgi:alpha/beta superfamily hydrolase